MTNMKDRLRPHRETKVKFQTKTRSINAKAKEKIAVRKNVLNHTRVTTKRNIKTNIIPHITKTQQRIARYKSAPVKAPIGKRSPKSIGNNKSSKATPKSTRRGNSKTNKFTSNTNVIRNVPKIRKLPTQANNATIKKSPRGKARDSSKAISQNIKKEDLENNNKKINQTKDKPKRTYTKRKNVMESVDHFENNVSTDDSEEKNKSDDTSDEKVWEKDYLLIPVNGKIECVSYKMAQKSTIRKLSDKPRHHKCTICSKAFLGKNDLRKHCLIHYGLLPFECTQCQKRFRQAGNLRNHVISYHPDTLENPSTFECDYCHKQFLIKERLRLHIRVHTGFKPYECSLCPMSFARNGQMKQHIRTHTGEKNYQCDICKATFTCKAKLKMHVNRHYDIKNYTCYVCGKRFLRLDAYKKHLSCYHNDEKPFECTICHKKLKGHLAEHMRTHKSEKPHACDVCGSRFVQRSQLTVHLRMHSGARPYRCRVCWKAFAHSTALTLHTRHHTGEKPFPCRICSVPFSQLSHLKKHMLILHGDARAYSHPACKEAFHTKSQLDKHLLECTAKLDPAKADSPEEKLSKKIAESFQPSEPLMALTKMRLLLAVLLKKICSKQKLQRLGFNKRLVDDILLEALDTSGKAPCTDPSLSPSQRLKLNVQKFLEWTVPPNFMARFKDENKSTEELLEELTS